MDKHRKQVSIDGCKVIGKGKNGTVYYLNEEQIIKVFHEKNTIDDVENEKNMARYALIHGLPTAISFEIVAVESHLALIYELVDSKNLLEKMIRESASERSMDVERFIDLMKSVHEIQADSEILPDARERFGGFLSEIKDQMDEESFSLLQEIFQSIPGSHHLIHGDLHPGNVMEIKGQLVLIDMDTLGQGPILLEWVNLYCTLIGFHQFFRTLTFFEFDDAGIYEEIWMEGYQLYYSELKKAKRDHQLKKIQILAMARMLRYACRYQRDMERMEIKEQLRMALANWKNPERT